jgi:hypothetical protein
MFATELKETLSTVNKSELARSIGCHRDTICKWQKGNQLPTIVQLLPFVKYLYPEHQVAKAYLMWSELVLAQYQDRLDNK